MQEGKDYNIYITIRAIFVRTAIAKGTAREANAPIYASFSRQFGNVKSKNGSVQVGKDYNICITNILQY